MDVFCYTEIMKAFLSAIFLCCFVLAGTGTVHGQNSLSQTSSSTQSQSDTSIQKDQLQSTISSLLGQVRIKLEQKIKELQEEARRRLAEQSSIATVTQNVPDRLNRFTTTSRPGSGSFENSSIATPSIVEEINANNGASSSAILPEYLVQSGNSAADNIADYQTNVFLDLQTIPRGQAGLLQVTNGFSTVPQGYVTSNITSSIVRIPQELQRSGVLTVRVINEVTGIVYYQEAI